MSAAMLHGLGDCTEELNCGCLEPKRTSEEQRPVPEWDGGRPWKVGDRFVYQDQLLEVTDVLEVDSEPTD